MPSQSPDPPNDFVPRYAGISEVRQCAVYQEAVGMANAASLDSDANLIWAGIL